METTITLENDESIIDLCSIAKELGISDIEDVIEILREEYHINKRKIKERLKNKHGF